jgi:iron complex outermembrane receptor protein
MTRIPTAFCRACTFALLISITCVISICGATDAVKPPPKDLAELSVEELARVKITSVSKRPESLAGAAAAIHVVTDEDMHRQGFRTIADSLRYVPGMQVAQINSHTWGVSSRGFNGEYATKLLVLMDGRSVYTPLFAGVYWDVQDAILEDLDRIEVIRGPGATLWGANAVNGVINITSKSSKDTQGWLVTSGGGSEEHGFNSVRYGGQLGENTYYRVFGKYDNRDDTEISGGSNGHDEWWIGRGGFRLDSGSAESDLFTLQGDLYSGQEKWFYDQSIATAPYDESVLSQSRFFGANLLGRWTHCLANDSEIMIQAYYDRTERASNLPKETRDTFDFEAQHRFSPISRNEVVWGVGVRTSEDKIQDNYANTFQIRERHLSLASFFLQDEITLSQDLLRLTIGSKCEYNTLTHFEFEPSTKLAWTPSDQHTIWTAVSRAVRTPSRAEEDVRVNRTAPTPPFPAGSVISILGDRDGESEKLIAYELGYRALPHPRLSFDVATFYNVYDELRSLEAGAPPNDPPVPVVTYHVQNALKGTSWGYELAADWQMLDWWSWRGTYTYFNLDLRTSDGGTDQATIQLLEGNAPQHQFTLRSQMNLPNQVEFDVGLRFVDALENPHVPAYTTFDVRLSWKPKPNLELSLIGLNLLEPRHAEFAATQVTTPQREVQRSVYAKISWRF